jgi:MFS family permease
MGVGARWRLAVMMALAYAVQGAWWPLLAVHLQDLGISGQARGYIFATLALGSLVSPLGMGYAADRLVATQRLLALVYGLGAGPLVLMASGAVVGVGRLFALFLVYWLLTAASYGLCNALAFRNLERPLEQFGGVRLWGTVGWMAAGWLAWAVMPASGSGGTGRGVHEAFGVAAVLSVVFAVSCLGLPHTPPLATGAGGRGERAEALALVRSPGVALYLTTAFGVCLTLPFVYQVMPAYLVAAGLPRRWVAPAMTLGQVPEIATLAALPWLLRRCGYRGTLALGILAWTTRYALLAAGPPLWMALAGILLHGVAIACFHVAGAMYLDGQAPPHRRAGTQGLNLMVTTGVGLLLGSLLAGRVVDQAAGDDARVFWVPCLINAGLLGGWLAGSGVLSKEC